MVQTAGSPDLAGFRRSTRDWLRNNYPDELRDGRSAAPSPVWRNTAEERGDGPEGRWLATLAEQGWIAPDWPREYGGAGLAPEQIRVIKDEMRRIGATIPLAQPNMGLTMVGPLLLEHGSSGQRRRFLPGIADGTVRWSQGFSEPGAGSDLPALRTRAERRGDHFVVTGHKTWSSYAHRADWLFCLVRTDPEAPKREGISLLLIDMGSAGVRVEPITLISGESLFCEVFLVQVRVPVEQLVGPEGAGWALARRLLEHERRMPRPGGEARTPIDRFAVEYLDGRPTDAAPRDRIARHLMTVQAFKSARRRALEEAASDPALPSLLKLAGSEAHMERHDLVAELLGTESLVLSDPESDTAGTVASEWLRSRGNSIEAGTSEIQLNTIARTVFGGHATFLAGRLSDDEALVRDTARQLAGRQVSASVRALRDGAGQPVPFDRELWARMAQLGWLELVLPEEEDGVGSFRCLGLAVAELAKALIPTPLTSVAAAAGCLAGLGGRAQELLADITRRGRVVVLAAQEGARFDSGAPRTRAIEQEDGTYRLRGHKRFVADGTAADDLLMTATLDGHGTSIFRVDPRADGLATTATVLMDHLPCAGFVLDGVVVPAADLIAYGPEADAMLGRAVDRASVLLAAEMCGGAEAVYTETVAYLRNREQFDAPLASFQALRHRVARVYVALTLARSVVHESLNAADRTPECPGTEIASIAKALANDAYLLAAREGLQMHGGIGMTDEVDIGLHLKRARVSAARWGDSAFHRDRLATARGL